MIVLAPTSPGPYIFYIISYPKQLLFHNRQGKIFYWLLAKPLHAHNLT